MFSLFKKTPTDLPKDFRNKLIINGQYYIPLKKGEKPLTTFGLMNPSTLHLKSKNFFRQYNMLCLQNEWDLREDIEMETDFYVNGKMTSTTEEGEMIFRRLNIKGVEEFVPQFIDYLEHIVNDLWGSTMGNRSYEKVNEEIYKKSFLSKCRIVHKDQIEPIPFGVLRSKKDIPPMT